MTSRLLAIIALTCQISKAANLVKLDIIGRIDNITAGDLQDHGDHYQFTAIYSSEITQDQIIFSGDFTLIGLVMMNARLEFENRSFLMSQGTMELNTNNHNNQASGGFLVSTPLVQLNPSNTVNFSFTQDSPFWVNSLELPSPDKPWGVDQANFSFDFFHENFDTNPAQVFAFTSSTLESFTVTSIPEPLSSTLFSCFVMSAILRRRRF